MTNDIVTLYGEASSALSKLDEISRSVPDLQYFIRAYVIKEGLLSSAIEDIHTTLVDVFTAPIDGTKPNKNTQLVLNYTKALDAAVKMLREEHLPLINRVILKAHAKLMSSGAGDGADPGQFRKQSVQVGSFTPPPATEIPNLLSALEKYMNEPSDLPPLIRAGLAHVYFETIHPFLDGNGRIGRLLIVLMLMQDNLLHAPILYPSYYFKKHRLEYYQKLNAVRVDGDFEGWIYFYLMAIKESAIDAYQHVREIEGLHTWIINLIKTDVRFKKRISTAEEILELLFKNPVTSITALSQAVGKAYNTVHDILMIFSKIEVGRNSGLFILSEGADRKRNKLYRFDAYLHALECDLS